MKWKNQRQVLKPGNSNSSTWKQSKRIKERATWKTKAIDESMIQPEAVEKNQSYNLLASDFKHQTNKT
jgi:hypothetical protein